MAPSNYIQVFLAEWSRQDISVAAGPCFDRWYHCAPGREVRVSVYTTWNKRPLVQPNSRNHLLGFFWGFTVPTLSSLQPTREKMSRLVACSVSITRHDPSVVHCRLGRQATTLPWWGWHHSLFHLASVSQHTHTHARTHAHTHIQTHTRVACALTYAYPGHNF